MKVRAVFYFNGALRMRILYISPYFSYLLNPKGPTANVGHRDYEERRFTVGLGGPVGSGKTALLLALCRKLRERMSVAAVTNDIFTREDCEFLTRNEALPTHRITAVETGGCPHAAIR